jgi:hypothetical protein
MFSSRIYGSTATARGAAAVLALRKHLSKDVGIPASYGQKDVVPAKSPPSNQKENGQSSWRIPADSTAQRHMMWGKYHVKHHHEAGFGQMDPGGLSLRSSERLCMTLEILVGSPALIVLLVLVYLGRVFGLYGADLQKPLTAK